MSYKHIVRSSAEADILRAYRWYEAELEGLGTRFLESVDAGFERITASPLHYSEIAGGIRRKLLNKFPFGLFFVFEDEEVGVLAVLQHSQSPNIWKGRK